MKIKLLSIILVLSILECKDKDAKLEQVGTIYLSDGGNLSLPLKRFLGNTGSGDYTDVCFDFDLQNLKVTFTFPDYKSKEYISLPLSIEEEGIYSIKKNEGKIFFKKFSEYGAKKNLHLP
ncbi:hypothetical protein EHQ55_11120 [Leptospira meyeri]|uniref:hypothetical protein n=1 Tax=Leptospira meyeri TaxID=29508 RepID=UPI0010843D5B|nr:hypothetical protein [Leptospira meyeri]TGL47675.1 hypothetical protein EHQ55_11120 [Leptospira meyeri]